MTVTPENEVIARLIKQFESGEARPAWEVFLSRYSDLIFRILSYLDSDQDNQSDSFLYVCQQLHRNRFRRLRQFDPAGSASFSTWLRAVVRNLYLDWRRKRFGPRSWAPTVSLDQSSSEGGPDRVDMMADEQLNPENAAALEESLTELKAALSSLDSSEMRILKLRFEHDLTLDQIAQIVGLGSPQSARYHLQKVLAKLRSKLD